MCLRGGSGDNGGVWRCRGLGRKLKKRKERRKMEYVRILVDEPPWPSCFASVVLRTP